MATTADPPERAGFTAASADELAARALAGLNTRLGGRQITHARRVAAVVRATHDDRAVAAALLHDVVEKGSISLDDLLERSCDHRLVALVDLLTRRDDETEEHYLQRCAGDPVALAIKRADLADKLSADDAQVDEQTAHRLREQARARLEMLETLARAGAPAPEGPRDAPLDLLRPEPVDTTHFWSTESLIEVQAQLDELDRLKSRGLLTDEEFDAQRRAVADG
jgi:hypothetical protein